MRGGPRIFWREPAVRSCHAQLRSQNQESHFGQPAHRKRAARHRAFQTESSARRRHDEPRDVQSGCRLVRTRQFARSMVLNRQPSGSAAYRAARLTEAYCFPSRAEEPRALRADNPRLFRNRPDRVAIAGIRSARRSGILHEACANPLSGGLPAGESHGLEHPFAAERRLRVTSADLGFARFLSGVILFVHIFNRL